MKKIIKKAALTILLIPVALVIAGTFYYFLYALLSVGGESTEHQSYLNKNKEIIEIGAPDNFTLFDSAFYRNQIFLLAEVHGFAAPQELDFELLKHLHQKTGLKYYLAEVDYSQAYFLNQYLQTGDEDFLRYVFNTWVHMNLQWGNRNFYNKLKKIHTFNQSLPEDERISCIGVDKIQDIAVTNRSLREILKKQNYRRGNHAYLDSLAQLIKTDTMDMKKAGIIVHKLLGAMENDTASKKMLGSEINNFKHILKNIIYYKSAITRDNIMFLNLKKLIQVNDWQNEKMYGMWGFAHTLPGAYNNGKIPFAAFLNSDSAFKNKVIAMNIFSIDGENMIPAKSIPPAISKGKAYLNTSWINSNGPLAFVNGINDLIAVTQENSITLFKMDTHNSPYVRSSKLVKINVFIPGKSIAPDAANPTIAEAFPYVFLIRNSEALQPIEE